MSKVKMTIPRLWTLDFGPWTRHKSYRFWIVVLLAASHISFFSDLDSWWYRHKSFPARVKSVRANFQKGIVLPLFALEQDYPYKQAIDEIADLGARSVSLFVTNYQEDIRSNYIYVNRRAVEPLQLGEIIEYAHQRGLSVFLFPTLHIWHLGYKEWRGVLKPTDLNEWWNHYSRLIRFYTHIARQQNVEMLSIGSELCAMEKDYDRWNQIIRYCRKNYPGVLTYSANWDHYHNIPFIRQLDYMGMNAYFGLTRHDNPKMQELLSAWDPAKKRVQEAYSEYKTPILFTEIGYPSVNGANRDPWNYLSTAAFDGKEQELCYKAFVKVWSPPPPFLHGVYFYNWWGEGGGSDRDYTPRGKPAERVLRNWYRSF